MPEKYDVVVVGAGHAGCEAARASARMGLRTALVTMKPGPHRADVLQSGYRRHRQGHLVREIDALGGVMGEVADAVGIQFRLLNTSRGPAVWSPRAQMDKKAYRVRMREVLEQEPNLCIRQAEVAALAIKDGRIGGVRLRDGGPGVRRGGGDHRHISERVGAYRGSDVQLRAERRAAVGVAGRSTARTWGLRSIRLKTGTPPRLDGRTIDWSQFQPQPGDALPTPFSF